MRARDEFAFPVRYFWAFRKIDKIEAPFRDGHEAFEEDMK